MKRILTALVCLAFVGCSATVQELKQTRERHPPEKLSLKPGYNDYVKRHFLEEEKVECGRIFFANGDYADYWFKSHHLTKDAGFTYFVFSDDKAKIMEGWFCCEVQLPHDQLSNKHALIAFIEKHDGMVP
ncbi:hypothetical protein DDZ13_12980 [Coraliomargarita sinensis]|uniref:Lipoprotein n=1 Tax=Coraliomargarita sinensis TaxID=2174842 RepID=A0A317ZDX5_9BACT|nr:hypothetical protein [Coraliomargarita sinensis]PXA03330.1 hypothetical protein DDZ13_12980 [Coraliomargarita sinensis]